MANSRPCRELPSFATGVAPEHHTRLRTRHQISSASARLAELVSNERRDEGSAFGEIQLHADAVGIVEEELRVAGARNDTLAEFHAFRLQALAHGLDAGRGEGNVIEPAGVLVFFLGAAHHDAFARLARA